MAVTNDFTSSELDLNGKIGVSSPTALVWGPDGRLYVTEVDGDVKILTVAFGDPDPADGDPTAKFFVTAAETVTDVKTIPNFNDDGTPAGGDKRQVTGIDVTRQYDSNGDPVLIDGKPAVVVYVSSSDSRIGAGGDGNDANLDTNSGIITRLTQTADGWDTVDLVRGLARSEENHATNGMEVIQELDASGKLVSERMIVANGGNANTGAPSNNFAGQQEQPLSAAILEVDLTELAGMGVKTDAASGRQYVYDLPTLDDPTRAGAEDAGDPFGGNDGLNSAKLIADGPVQIYSAGYRNAYDVEVTEDGRVWTYDNGANNNWGGRPAGEDSDGDTNSTEAAELGSPPAGYIATNLFVEDNNEIAGNYDPQNWDQLHEVTRSDDLNGKSLSAGQGGALTYQWDHPDFDEPLTLVYGGHANPTRAEGARAGILYSPQDGVGGAKLMVSNVDKGDGASDFLEVVQWFRTIGYSDSFIASTVVALDPGVRYADQFVANYALPTQAGEYSLVEDANGPLGLPADIGEIVHQVNPIEGDFREAGFTDGAVDTGKGSVNGLAEYTSSIFEEAGQPGMQGALIAASLGQGQYYIIGRDGDGIVQTAVESGRTIAGDRAFFQSGGAPLGVASIGDDLSAFGNNGAFRGSVWGAIYKQNGPIIEIMQPGNPEDNALLGVNFYAGQEPADPEDNDLDGVDHLNDPFEFDADNGVALGAGERIELNFSQVDLASNPEFSGTIGDTGLMGAALDGTTPNRDAITGVYSDGTNGDGAPASEQQDGLFDNAGNIIPGGNAPILQIKSVQDGTAVGGANTLRDGLQTGVRLNDDVKRLVAEVDIANWYNDQPGGGRITGVMLGDGTQFNFVRFVWGDVGGELGLEVGIEVGDSYQVLQTVVDPDFAAALTVGTDTALNTRSVTLQLEISGIGDSYDIAARYRTGDGSAFTEIALDAALPEGVLRDVLDGTHTISDGDTTLPSGAAIGIVAEKDDGVSFTAVDFPEIRIEAFGNEIAASDAAGVQNAAGTAGTDTVVYDGGDTDLGTLPGDVENFDGSGSDADYALTANALDNVIRVGAGANTITTGAGADVVRGDLADLDGDTVTDFGRDDSVLIEGFSSADIQDVSFAQGSAIITINGATFTLDGEDFTAENFDPADGAAYFDFTDTAEGLEITSRAPLSPVVAINAGGTGGESFSGTLRETELTFIGDGGGSSEGPGFRTTGANKAYTNGTAQSFDFPGTDLDAILASERSSGSAFGYEIDVPDGTYLVDLIFAEIFFGFAGTGGSGAGESGNRIFDVDVEGQEVFSNVDVQAEAGGAGLQLVKSYEVEVTDGVLNIELNQDAQDVNQSKLSGLVVWSAGGSFTPVDAADPVVESITLENPQNVQDGTRTATVVVTDETGFAAGAFDGLSGSVLQVGGITPDAVTYGGATLSDGGRTATLTFEITGEDNAWINGTTGTLSLAAGTFNDAAGNGSAAASSGFVIQSNLDDLDRGAVVRAINIGTASQDVGTLDPDQQEGGATDDATYGGAIAADSLITDAFGNPVAFEADSDAYHTDPKANQFANVDGKSGITGSNSGGVDLDGSAYHTYRDSTAGSWTSTFDGFENGTYVVELHFAELFASSAEQSREGDFTVNGTVFGDDYDVFEVAGGADRPTFIRKAVTVTDGTIQVLVDDVTSGQPGYSGIVVYEAVDPAAPSVVSIGDVTVLEGDLAEITITRTGDLSEEVSVDVEVEFDGTASVGDVGALSANTVTFGVGQSSVTVTLPITDDDETEGAETLSVALANLFVTGTGQAEIGDGTATVTIGASDSDLAAPAGATILDLDFEGVEGEALAVGGFDGALGTSPGVVDEATSQVTGGRLVVQTSEGDINDGTDNGSGNDFTRSVDLSDPALTEIYISTRFENPFDEALLTSQGITDGIVPNFVQQGIVFGTGTQLAGEQVKLVWGGVANGTGTQIWSKGGGGVGVDQKVGLSAMLEGGQSLFDVASVELSLVIDRDAGTVAQYVTLFDDTGTAMGGVRPVATAGYTTAAPVALPAAVLANLNDGAAPTHVGVTSSDNSSPVEGFASFEATWDFLRLSSPQFVDGPPADSVNGVAVEGGDFSDDRTAPTGIGVLAEGETTIVATQQGDDAPGGRERDYFTFTVAEGQELTGIVLEGWETDESGTPQAFIGLNDSGTIPTDPVTFEGADQMLGGYVYSSGDVANPAISQDGNLIDELGDGSEQGVQFRDADNDGQGDGFTPPLPAGTYTIWLNQGGASSTATLKLVTAPVAPGEIVLSIADAPAIVEAGDDGTTDLAFAVTASEAFTGSIEVAFDQGGIPSTQTVAFDGGAGVLTIPVANDADADGDDTVDVTLTGGTSTDTASAISISAAAASASGTVTEDDVAGSTFVRGGIVAAYNAGGPALSQDGIDFLAAPSGTDGAPFAGGTAFVDSSGGNGQQPVYDGTVYETEINDGGNDATPGSFTFSSALGIDPAKSYFVDLYFAEIYTDAVGGRVFDVSLEGELVLSDLDVVAATGDADTPLVVELAQPVSPGANGAIDLSFVASTDRAKISAIVIREAIDPSAVSVSVADVTVSEEAGTAEVTFTREGNVDTDMVIAFSTADVTATAGADYAASPGGTITILAGETAATTSIALTGDALEEGDESFTVAIESAVADGASVTIADAEATVTLIDDDGIDPADIDGDGILNEDDPFAYDGQNGLGRVLGEGVTFRQDFDTDTTDVFSAEGGFTGILVNPQSTNIVSTEADPYGNRTTEATSLIEDGVLKVTSSETDVYGNDGNPNATNNNIADNYQSAADVSGVDSFSVEGKIQGGWLGTAPGSFASFGITLGAGGTDEYIKFVVGGFNDGVRLQLGQETSLVGVKDQNVPFDALTTPFDPSLLASVIFTIDVDKTTASDTSAGTLTATATFLDASGAEIGAESLVRDIDPAGTLAAAMAGNNPLTGGTGGVAYGVSITDWSGAAQFEGQWDYLEISGPEPVNDAPTAVTLTPATLVLAEGVDTAAGSVKVADIAVADDDLGTNVLTLTGADAALFEIVEGAGGPELHIVQGAAIDFEAASQLDVTVEVDDAAVGGTPDAAAAFTLTIEDVNEAPTLSVTPLVASLAEDADTSAAIAVATVAVTDDALGTNDLTLAGTDAEAFEIVDNAGTLEIRLKAGTSLDFETLPSFDVSVVLDDAALGDTAEAIVPIALDVTDVAERTRTADTPEDLPTGGGGTDETDVVAYTGSGTVGGADAPYALPDGFEDFDAGGATGTVNVAGNAGDNAITVGTGADDTVDLTQGGSDTVIGTAEALDGTEITGLGADDEIVVTGGAGATIVDVRNGSTIIDIDTDGVEGADATITLAETVDPSRIRAVEEDGDLVISIAADQPPANGTPIGDRSFAEDAPIDFALPEGTFTDDAGERNLTLTATLASGEALPSWLAFDPETRSFSGLPDQAEVDAGPLSITVTATDAEGASAEDTFTLTVTNSNDAPVAADDSGDAFQGFSATFTAAALLGNDADQDGDPLTLASVSNPSTGTVELVDGDAVFTPDPAFSGTASFDYEVADGNGGTDTGTVTVDVIAGEPLEAIDVPVTADRLSGYSTQDAQPDSVTILDDGIEIAGNSWKALALGAPLDVVDGTKLRFTFSSTDLAEINAIGLENDNSLTGGQPQLFFGLAGSQVQQQLDGRNGFARMTEAVDPLYRTSDGEQTYTIDLSAYAGQSFTSLVFLNDADSQTGNGTFRNVQFLQPITLNSAPVAQDDAYSVAAGGTLSLAAAALLANDTDVDGNALTITAVGNAQGGTVAIDPGTGLIEFVADADAAGPASFEYTVSDGKGGTDTGSVAVAIGQSADVVTDVTIAGGALSSYDIQDRAPSAFEVADGGATLRLNGNSWKKLDLPGDGYEITADTKLRFTFSSDDLGEINAIGLETDNQLANDGQQLFFGLAGTEVAGGSFRRMTEAVEPFYTPADGARTYEIDLGAYAGQTYDYLVFVNDADSQSGSSAFTGVQFVETGTGSTANAAPVAQDDSFAVEENGVLVLTPGDLLSNDADADGDALSIAAVGNAVGGTVEIDPLGRVVFTPTPESFGDAGFEYTLSDGRGGTDTGTVAVTVFEEGAGETVTEIDFAFSAISSYGGQDARPNAGFDVGGGGASLTLDGNVWKTVDLGSFEVTDTTVLRFDLTIDALGEIHGIGLDSDNTLGNGGVFFQLAGTQTLKVGDQTYRGEYGATGETVSYEIDLSAHAGQSFDRMVFINDHDIAPSNPSETFANVRLVDGLTDTGGAGEAPYIVGGEIADIALQEGGAFEVNLPILDDDSGFEVTFDGLPDFVTADGTFLSGTPEGGDVGTYTVTVTATDPDLNRITDTFEITVGNVNDAPVAAAQTLPEVNAVLGSDLSIPLPADFFTDEDPGDVLTYSLEGPAAGLTIDPQTGEISGTPDTAGPVVLTIRATDPSAAFAEATLTLNVADGPPRESVLIEAENFTGLGAEGSNFFVEVAGNASNDRLIRLMPNQDGEISTDLSAAGTAPGFYDLVITYYDESDGTAELTVLIDNGSGPEEIAVKLFDATGLPGQGNALQSGNIQSFTIPGVEVASGARLILRGSADGELVRIDKVELDPVDNAAPVLAAAATVAVGENAADVATIAAVDPEGQDVTYAISGGDDAALFGIDAQTGALSFLAAPDFEAPADAGGDNVYDVTVSASDGARASEQAVSVTVTDVNEAPVGAAPGAQQATQGESVSLPTLDSLFADPDLGDTVTYAVDQLPAGVTLAADGVTLEGAPTTLGTTTVTVTATDGAGLTGTVSFDVTVVEEGAFDPAAYAPDGDLDGDTILNAVDTDVDGDGVDNADDRFAYDDEDGMTLAAGETKTYEFDLDGTIWENGMTGFLQATANGGAFDEDTGAATVSGGAMVVDPVTGGDTGGANNPQDDAVVGVRNGTFTATASVVNPWAGAATNPNSFDQLGLVLGLDSADMIKLVFGQSGGVVEFQKQDGDVATKFGGASASANIPFPAGVTFDNFATAEITFEVTSTDAASATVAGSIRFIDGGGAEIGSLGPIDAPIGGALAAALADPGTGVAVGFTHVNGGGDPGFVAELDSLEITAPGDPGDGTGGTGGDDEQVVFRINAGGPTVAATDGGPAWLGDSVAAPIEYLTVTDNRADVGGSATSTFEDVPDAIFAEARSSDGVFSYDIPVDLLGGGENYEVRLYFAEIFSGGQAGDFRNFDATLEGLPTAAFNNIDPGALFGAGAGMLTGQVNVSDGVLNIGFEQDVKQNPIINGIEIVAIDSEVVNPDPVDPAGALEAFAAQDDLATDAQYTGGETGSAVLEVMTGNDNIQSSNFGANSFQVTNTGGKAISAIYIDVNAALYPDSVFDPDGQGGDNAAKPWQINSEGGTGAYISGTGYFDPGQDPLPNTTGTGGSSNGGFKGAMVKFTDFDTNETVGFSGDMDPNSIAGLTKSSVDGSAILSWDVGGISGHELIGSTFTVLFDDGSTATGQLASDGSSAGAQALAVEGGPSAAAPGLAVGGVLPGQTGTYGGTRPVVTVTGDPGDRVQITMSKGFNPVTETDNGIAALVQDRLDRYEFNANNAFDAQTVIVTIGQDGTFDASSLFDYDDAVNNNVGSGSFAGDDVADIAFVATKVAAGGSSPLPISPTTAPIYLSNEGGPVAGDATGGTGGVDGYYEIVGNSRFKVQIEDENANGGQDPGGKWSFADAQDGDGNQSGFQGEGYYLFGSDTSTAINGVNGNETLAYTVFIPDEAVGTYNFRARVSRDGTAASDQQNDLWLNFRKEGTNESIEDYLVEGSNEPEPTDSGFVKIFGGPNNGSWGFASNWDGVPSNPATQLSITEGGLYTIEIAGRSQGFHVDFFDLFKGGAPSAGAGDSAFVEGEPVDGGGGDTGGPDGTLVIPIDASADDWEQRGGAGSADFEIGENGGPQWSALRFDGIDIPDGAVIESAFIRFQADGDQTGDADFAIAIEDTENAAGYSAGNLPSSRSYVADEFAWNDVAPWNDGGTYDTGDISALIEAVIGDDGVQDGALGFFFDGAGKRAAVSFDGDGAAPELHIVLEDGTF